MVKNSSRMNKQNMTSSKIVLTGLMLSLLLINLFYSQAFAKVTAGVDRQYAYEGETITLSVRSEDNPQVAPPDFSVLNDDFTVGGTSQSSSVRIINGHRTDAKTWSVRLIPNKLGQITIPALSVGSEQTAPITIDIKPVPIQSGNHQGQPVFVTLEVDSDEKIFYVQQHIPVVARLYYKHELGQGRLTDPASDDILLERLGEDSSYRTQYNGSDYRVHERRYSLIAEKSGELVVPSVKFQGQIITPQTNQQQPNRRDPFARFFNTPSFSNSGQQVSIRSEALTLQIAPHPTTFSGQQWLPAESLELVDSWTQNPPEFKVGEPVSRTITIQARGLVASQIQPLELPSISSFRRYAEPAETETRTDGKTVFATSRRMFTYIPAYPGTQTIPALDLYWWNVNTHQEEIARLPSWEINVGAASNPQQSIVAPSPQQLPADISPATENDDSDTPSLSSFSLEQWLDPYLYWLLGAIVSVLVMLFFIRMQTRNTSTNQRADTTITNEAVIQTVATPVASAPAELQKKFKHACQQQDAKNIHETLLSLAQLQWPDDPPMNLGSIAAKINDPQALQALEQLDRHLYAASDASWNAQSLYECFKDGFPEAHRQQSQKSVLKPLYPES